MQHYYRNYLLKNKAFSYLETVRVKNEGIDVRNRSQRTKPLICKFVWLTRIASLPSTQAVYLCAPHISNFPFLLAPRHGTVSAVRFHTWTSTINAEEDATTISTRIGYSQRQIRTSKKRVRAINRSCPSQWERGVAGSTWAHHVSRFQITRPRVAGWSSKINRAEPRCVEIGWLASSRFVRSLWARVSEVEEREEEEGEGIHSRGFRREQESTCGLTLEISLCRLASPKSEASEWLIDWFLLRVPVRHLWFSRLRSWLMCACHRWWRRRGRERERNRRREGGGGGGRKVGEGEAVEKSRTRTQSPVRLGSFSSLPSSSAPMRVSWCSYCSFLFLCVGGIMEMEYCIFTICKRGGSRLQGIRIYSIWLV